MIRPLALALLLGAPAAAHEFAAGALTIDHPVIYAGPPTAKAAAGYMTIRNGGDDSDRLTAVSLTGATAEIHRSQMRDGVMTMEEVADIEIPAGGAARLAPGGLHVMILGLPEGPAEGDRIEAILMFERAGEVEVTFNVETRPADGGGHSGH